MFSDHHNYLDTLTQKKELDTHSGFLPFLQGRQILLLPVSFPAHLVPSEKGSTLKGKNLLPRGANSFLLEKIPFQKGVKEFDSCLP